MGMSRHVFVLGLLVALSAGPLWAADSAGIEAAKEGDTLDLGGRKVTVKRLDILPYVDNEFTRRCTFDKYENPKLQKLRSEYGLDKVVAGGASQFAQQLMLMCWAYDRFDFGDPKGKGGMRNSLEILELAKKEQKFFCVQRASLLVSAAASVGYVCRPCGHSSHSWTEMWSNEHRKWIFFDPTPNAYAEKEGQPLSTYEARQESFINKGEGLVFVNGQTGKKTPRQLRYSRFRVIPNTNWLDSRPQYGRGVQIQGDPTNKADNEAAAKAAAEAYFPINQAALTLKPYGDDLKVDIKTLTPNFKTFRVRVDDGQWADSEDNLVWALHEGTNTLQAKSVNKFGIDGPVSTVVLDVAGGSAAAVGPIVIPAIHFTGQGGGQVNVMTKQEEASPSYAHLWHEKGHWLEWTVEDAAGGQYDVTLRYAARFPTSRRMQVNGRPVEGLESFSLEPTGGWTAFRDIRLSSPVSLAKGRNALRLTAQGDASLCLNRILLTSGHDRDIVVDGMRFSREGGGKAQRIVSDGGGYFILWNAKDHWLQWTLDDAPAGRYDVYLHYSTMAESPRDMQVNGQAVKGLESFTLAPTSGWRYWVEAKLPGGVTLKQGRNVIRMNSLGGKGFNLAAIRLVGPDGKDILIDAASFTDQGGGNVRVVAPSRHGYFNFWNEKGHWLEWTAAAPAAGKYELTLRYATRANSPRELRVNGEVVEGLESFTLPRTSDWKTWKQAKLSATVTLSNGRNVLRMTSLGGGGLNLDEIRLSPIAK